MVRVSPIKLQAGSKVLWFDPETIDVHKGDSVIVSTERGTEFGIATADIMEVSDDLVENLKSPLKPVIRVADEADLERAAQLAQQGEEALKVFKELAFETNEQMRPVMVEFLFDGEKAVFYFEADERIDFRDLVRKLASRFHVRVDMRQIGVRDGARMIGGLGHCGQELCCKRLGGEFSSVSIRMAKEQNLSLNPQKISGCCGRLMCCLRYEYEVYKEVNARAPKLGAKIEVPDGVARVTEVNVPLERVSLQLEDGKTIKVPLADMEVVGEGKRPNRISQEVFDTYAAADPLKMFEAASFEVTNFTGSDKLASPSEGSAKKVVNHSNRTGEDSHRKPRRRRRVSSAQKEASSAQGEPASRPSGVRQGAGEEDTPDARKGSGKKNASSRRPRRARSKQDQQSTASSSHAEGNEPNKRERQTRARNGRSSTEARSTEGHVSRDRANKQRTARRPGQKSSGVRNAPQSSTAHLGGVASPSQGEADGAPPAARGGYRKPRRRSHKAGGEGTTHE